MPLPYPRMAEPERIEADLAVVGAGAAGLYAAYTGARSGARVALISATPLARTASYWAQGGLAAALAIDDSPDLHREDTERAGRALVRSSAAAVLCREAPRTVSELELLGIHFDADRHGNLALGLEGGHSRRRVVHAGGSATGRRVVRQLSAVVVETEGITVIEGARAARLWTHDGRCVGVVCEDGRAVHARAVILATGGSAAMWRRTTNPPGSLGIGLLLAREAGAALADLELMQFHPTAVTGIKGREGFLITEAIRGEGATLLDGAGERFVDELAPRDEVARAIWATMTETGAQSVDLDMRAVDPLLFPNVVSALREAGLDPACELIPVAPAAHYGMGGVVADLDGATTVPGLYAVGESACTGLHGANRLASNSLSECFVFGARAALAALSEPREEPGHPPTAPTLELPSRETRTALWQHAGLVRDAEGLTTLAHDRHPLAALIARHALLRTESRGAHMRSDHPDTDPALDLHHSVTRGSAAQPAFERWD
jgi:L-aspartate oxidase